MIGFELKFVQQRILPRRVAAYFGSGFTASSNTQINQALPLASAIYKSSSIDVAGDSRVVIAGYEQTAGESMQRLLDGSFPLALSRIDGD
jgi:hypothetical protein